tara:strand:- start:5179 stop:5949 length:771 start_codon:yes stop_codon:yes gene_type:complete
MTQILGFAGKKQSGKNTACNYIIALKLAELGISKKTRLSKGGEVEITDIFGETITDKEWFGFNDSNLNVNKLFNDSLGKFVRIYGLADTLKDLCINILGLEYNQAYGTDKEKNSETHIKWGDLPHLNGHMKNTRMTAREVLQYVGTDIFRKLDSDVWIKSLLRKIEKDKPEVALICDVRFKNEISRLQEKGGFILGLTRDPYSKSDSHSSEKEIEECFALCDSLIDNKDMNIKEQLRMIHKAIKHLPNVLPIVEEE